jgi:hypothetical protein
MGNREQTWPDIEFEPSIRNTTNIITKLHNKNQFFPNVLETNCYLDIPSIAHPSQSIMSHTHTITVFKMTGTPT